jgi:hypothetical protein
MSITQSGFEPTTQGLSIDKDPQAQLVYTFDWSEWLPEGDSVQSVEYHVKTRINDPDPVTIVSEGVSLDVLTFVELAGGQLNKAYSVSAKITTANGLIERRSFRVRVVTRSA